MNLIINTLYSISMTMHQVCLFYHVYNWLISMFSYLYIVFKIDLYQVCQQPLVVLMVASLTIQLTLSISKFWYIYWHCKQYWFESNRIHIWIIFKFAFTKNISKLIKETYFSFLFKLHILRHRNNLKILDTSLVIYNLLINGSLFLPPPWLLGVGRQLPFIYICLHSMFS